MAECVGDKVSGGGTGKGPAFVSGVWAATLEGDSTIRQGRDCFLAQLDGTRQREGPESVAITRAGMRKGWVGERGKWWQEEER